MIRRSTIPHRLTSAEIILRALISCGLVLLLFGLRSVNPASVSAFQLQTSCGVITGLPCIFCGGTRAMHYLLRGEFARALYFNWLAFPVLLVVLAVIAVCLAELLMQRRLAEASFTLNLTRGSVAWTGVALASLWLLQVSLAVSMNKRELLNPAGLLTREIPQLLSR